MSPRVSVVVPAYNRETTIGATLSSILTQTVQDVEAVVVDDGSQDRTVDIVRSFPSDRVRLVEQANAGPSAARNAAVAASTGEIIATCDSDDYLLPNHLEVALRTLDSARGGKVAVSCTAYVIERDGLRPRRTTTYAKIPSLADQRLAMLQSNWASYLLVAPRAMFEETGGYEEDLRSSEDWDLWLRALFSGWQIARVTEPTALYMQVANSLSHDRGTMTATENRVVQRVVDAYGDRMTPEERAYCERRLREGSPMDLAARADAAFLAGRADEGARLLRQASSLNPRESKVAVKAKVGALPGGPRLLEWYAKRSS